MSITPQRKIIHLDMDAFFASVEMRERPALAQQPLIVAYNRPRSVVTTANYLARQYGLRSAMSVAQAVKLCPHVAIVEPNFALYKQVSQQVHQIFQRYTDLIEPLSLDEAYLDVSENRQNIPTATAVAMQIREEIWRETGLTASAGVAPNKFLAKIASDWHKPNGLFVIKPHQVADFIRPLKVEKIFGVGRVTLKKMHDLQLYTIADLQQLSEYQLVQYFGEKFGKRLFLYAQGIDDRPVQPHREYQQISKEITLLHDQKLAEIHWQAWQDLMQQLWQQLQRTERDAYGLSLKLKTAQFKIIQHSRRFQHHFRSPAELEYAVRQFLMELYSNPDLQTMPIRLIGLGVFALSEKQHHAQLSLL